MAPVPRVTHTHKLTMSQSQSQWKGSTKCRPSRLLFICLPNFLFLFSFSLSSLSYFALLWPSHTQSLQVSPLQAHLAVIGHCPQFHACEMPVCVKRWHRCILILWPHFLMCHMPLCDGQLVTFKCVSTQEGICPSPRDENFFATFSHSLLLHGLHFTSSFTLGLSVFYSFLLLLPLLLLLHSDVFLVSIGWSDCSVSRSLTASLMDLHCMPMSIKYQLFNSPTSRELGRNWFFLFFLLFSPSPFFSLW